MPHDEAAPPRATPLNDLHASLGAEIEGTATGSDLPIHFGSTADEYDALRRSCGVVDRSWVPSLEVTGEDRVRFVNGLVTCDVEQPAGGEGCYGFFTDAKGRVVADVGVLAHEDRLLLELPPGSASAVAEHMRKYVITDRVEIRPVDEAVCFAVAGPLAGRRLDRLIGEKVPRADWQHRRTSLLGHEVEICCHPNLGVSAWVVRVARAAASELFAGLVDRQGGGLVAAGHRAAETVRVEGGNAIAGIDLDAATLPQETGWTEAVSYTKGCYLGQEIVARIHYRGQVNRHLRGLLFGGDEAPEAGARVSLGGEAVGRLTSPTFSPELGQAIGLALIHRKASDPGTELEAGEEAAEITELPFVRRGAA